jgi:thymidylate synthase
MNLIFNDVNYAYSEVQMKAPHFSTWEDTRNGRARVFNDPVTLIHTHPNRRVLFDPVRDANPFFHYMEALWMLSGSNAVEFPSRFAKNLRNYSDDGRIFHGAYGHRWMHRFGFDQVDEIISMLQREPTTRRAVLSMWDPSSDLGEDSLDLPCNTHIYFRTHPDARLDMTVCNRSNDLVWGMLGANIVHFSILQEYIAHAANLRMGRLIQFTNNLHIYEGFETKFSHDDNTWYGRGHYSSLPFSPGTLNLSELQEFVIEPEREAWDSLILKRNAVPMFAAWRAYKGGDIPAALYFAKDIFDEDWSYACTEWLKRRQK